MPFIANTPRSNSTSATSRRVPGSTTYRRGTSTPTAPGFSARCWPTTSSAGRPPSVRPPPWTSAPSPAPSASDSSTSPAASSTGQAHRPCEAPSTGRGGTGSASGSPHCAPSNPKPAEPDPAARRTADDHLAQATPNTHEPQPRRGPKSLPPGHQRPDHLSVHEPTQTDHPAEV